MDNNLSLWPLFFGLILLGVAWILLPLWQLLRWLKRRRRLAFLRLNPEQAPLYSEQPLPWLILEGNPPPLVFTKRLSRGSHLILLAIWLGMAAIFMFGIISSAGSSPLSVPASLGIVLGGWSAYWAVLQGFLTLAFYQRIEASENSLLVQRGIIRRSIRWEQARLFAIDYTNFRGTTLHTYELSGPQQIVRWEWERSRRPRPQFTLKPAPPEYQRELERLKSYIHEKTGLPLRDLRFSAK